MTVKERLLALLDDYRGMRLTLDDVVDELNTTRDHAHTIIGELVRAGRINRDRHSGQVFVWVEHTDSARVRAA